MQISCLMNRGVGVDRDWLNAAGSLGPGWPGPARHRRPGDRAGPHKTG